MSTSSNSPVINIAGSNYLQFNNAVTGQGNQIGYNLVNTGASNSLDIIGNGSATTRNIKLWDSVIVNSGLTVGNGLTVTAGDFTLGTSASKPTITNAGAISNITTINTTGLITAGNGLTITAGDFTLGTSASKPTITNAGAISNITTINTTGLITAGNGLTVTAGDLKMGTTTTITNERAITCTSLSAGSGTISTSGKISTSGSGTITSAGLLTASNGLTASSGTINIGDSTNPGNIYVRNPTGQELIDSNTSKLAASVGYVSSNYVSSNYVIIPTGSIIAYMGSLDPIGWVICDGVARTYNSNYDMLIAMSIGTYSSTNSTYKPPDLTNKFLYGSSTLGTVGGSSSVTLTTSNMPSHTHGMDHAHQIAAFYDSFSDDVGSSYYGKFINYTTDTNHLGFGGRGNDGMFRDGLGTGGPRTAFTAKDSKTTTDSNGSGSAFNILPPYYTVKYIIKL